MYEMDNFNKIVQYHPHDFLESLEICIRFSKNSLLLCYVTMYENGTKTAEDTQTRALSYQPQC
jgi:hypothetical protein